MPRHPPPSTLFPYTTLFRSRKMMFQAVGHRPRTQQRVRLGATPDGKLVSLQHDYVLHQAILDRSEEHTSELQSRRDLVCRLLLEKKKNKANDDDTEAGRHKI